MQIPAKWLRGRVIGFIVLFVGSIFFLVKVKEVLVPFIWAAFLAYLLVRPVRFLEERGHPRTISILLVYFTLGAGVTIVLGLALPALLRELTILADTIPKYVGFYQNWLQELHTRYQYSVMPEAVRLGVNQALIRTEEEAVRMIGSILEGLIRGYSSLIIVVLAPILSFYFLKDVELIKRRFISALPTQWRGDILTLLSEIDRILLGFIRGNLLVCLMVGVLTAGILAVLGVNFALTLGIVAGVAELIPYFGPLIGALPAVGVAMLESTRLAVYTGVALLLIQQLESSVIAPKILGDRVGLHPLVIVFALLAGSKLWGIIGLLLAVPLAATIRVVINYIYLKCLED